MKLWGSTTKKYDLSDRAIRTDDYGNLCVVPCMDGIPKHTFLTQSGDGKGESNAIGNYSTSTDFFYQAPARFMVYSFFVCIADATAINQIDYGAITNGLTNGITFWVNIAGVEIPLFSGTVIKTNQTWMNLTHDAQLTRFPGTPQSFVPNFNLVRDFGMPLMLNTGDRFIARLHDNFSGLVDHTFALRGVLG
jgi:hypothetical protein